MTKQGHYEEALDEDLKDPVEAAGYLNACLEDGDPEIFLLALRDVVRAQGGIAKLAEMTELNREHLYRIFSENGNPVFSSLETLLDAMEIRLAVAPKEASKAKTGSGARDQIRTGERGWPGGQSFVREVPFCL